jgi:hypothetical protein
MYLPPEGTVTVRVLGHPPEFCQYHVIAKRGTVTLPEELVAGKEVVVEYSVAIRGRSGRAVEKATNVPWYRALEKRGRR